MVFARRSRRVVYERARKDVHAPERTTINRMRCFGQTAWTMCGAVKHNSSCSANINGAAVSL